MLRIERIKNPNLTTDNEAFRYGHPLYSRGLVDTLLQSNENTMFNFTGKEVYKNIGKDILNKAEQQNISIGKLFGVGGIDMLSLDSLPEEYNDVWFETNITNFIRLPKRFCRHILKRFKFIIVDYVEGGRFVGNNLINPIEELSKITTDFRQVVVATSGYHKSVKQGHNWSTLSIPMYLIYCYSYMHDVAKERVYSPNKLAMLLVNKPRYVRLLVLSKLHMNNLLEDSTWSCNINFDFDKMTLYRNPITKEELEQYNLLPYNEIWAGKVIDHDHPDYNIIEKFKRDNSHLFPKSIHGLDFVKDQVIETAFNLVPDLIGKHHFHIAVETDMESILPAQYNKDNVFTNGFVSDKTFKSFFYCNPTLLLGDQGSIEYCKKLGFVFPEKSLDLNLDNLHDSIDCIVDILSSPINAEENKFCAETNYNKVLDKDFLCNLVLDEINKLKEAAPTPSVGNTATF